MPDTVYNFNNALKSWKMNAYKISSISGDDLILNASNNNNIYLNVSGGLVNVSKDLDVSNNLYCLPYTLRKSFILDVSKQIISSYPFGKLIIEDPLLNFEFPFKFRISDL